MVLPVVPKANLPSTTDGGDARICQRLFHRLAVRPTLGPPSAGIRLKGGGGTPLPPPHCPDSTRKAFPYPNTSPNRISNRQKPPPPTAVVPPVTALQPLWNCPDGPPPLQAKPCPSVLQYVPALQTPPQGVQVARWITGMLPTKREWLHGARTVRTAMKPSHMSWFSPTNSSRFAT